MSLPSNLSHLYHSLGAPMRRRGYVVTALIAALAGVELLGVASVFPFLQVASSPEIIEENRYLSAAYRWSGAARPDQFLAMLAGLTFILLVVSAVFRFLTNYQVQKFVNEVRHSLGTRLLQHFLHQPYEKLVSTHSSDALKTMLSEVDVIVARMIRPIMNVAAHGFLVLVLTGLLVVINPLVAVVATVVLGTLYGLSYLTVKRRLAQLNVERYEANSLRFRSVHDALEDLKTLKLGALEDAYVRRFEGPSRTMARNTAIASTIDQIPRHLVEVLSIGGVLLIVIYYLQAGAGSGTQQMSSVLPVLGLYVFAGYRLLPSAQTVFASLAMIRLGAAALDAVCRMLDVADRNQTPDTATPVHLRSRIALHDVSFRYTSSERFALENISLEIPAGSVTVVTGDSGAGKTTLIDLIAGLLVPTRGEVVVDKTSLNDESSRGWQRQVAYVPQEIMLLDLSIRENIASSTGDREIDNARVQWAAGIAGLDAFLDEGRLDDDAATVGDRGVRLSGGQRQRIGIARALYRKPELLILDEATNALDRQTEDRILRSLAEIPELTIILVTHRPPPELERAMFVKVADGEVTVAARVEQAVS